jgi:ferrous iron transport protein B
VQETIVFSRKRKYSFTDILDFLLINRITGIPFFIISMWAVFQLVFQLGEYPTRWLEIAFACRERWSHPDIKNDILNPTCRCANIRGWGSSFHFLPKILLECFLPLPFWAEPDRLARTPYVGR